MGEILQINFGQCGNDIGSNYLEKLIFDHQLEKGYQCSSPKVCFEEVSNDQLLYRGAFVDFDQKSINKILSSNFIDPNLLIIKNCSNSSGAFHNSANIYKNEMKNDFEDAIRKQIEKCQHLDNFNYVYSIYDKYCGFATEALKNLVDQYPYQMHSNNVIYPSQKCYNPIEIYNATFAIHHLIEYSNFTLVYDYDALEKSTQRLQQEQNLQHYHDIIAETMLQSNCSTRFPGFQNGDLCKMSTNLICFPRMHFLTCSFSLIKSNIDLFQQIYSLSCLQNTYYTYPLEFENQYRSQVIISRGLDKYLEIKQFNQKMQNITPWIQDGFHHVNCKVQHRQLGETVMHIGNHRYYGSTLKPIQEAFTASFRRKAYIHYYTQQGADEMEFTEAESNLNDIISEYQEYCCPCYEDEDYEEEEY